MYNKLKEKDVCESCCVYKDKKDEFLRVNNSAFGAAADMYYFIQECKKTCTKIAKNK